MLIILMYAKKRFLYNYSFITCGLVTRLCLTLRTPWTVAHQAPLSMEFPRQKYRSGLPFSFFFF